jgi:hypothetical protein
MTGLLQQGFSLLLQTLYLSQLAAATEASPDFDTDH